MNIVPFVKDLNVIQMPASHPKQKHSPIMLHSRRKHNYNDRTTQLFPQKKRTFSNSWSVEITEWTHMIWKMQGKQYESWSKTQLSNHIHWFHSGEEFYLRTMHLWKVHILHVNLTRFSLWTYNYAFNNITEQ